MYVCMYQNVFLFNYIYVCVCVCVRAVVLESGLETFFYRLGLVLDSLVFGLGLGHWTRQMF